MANGTILYQGPSLLDGKPIVCIGLKSSDNVKTGAMAQTFILRADIGPIEAVKTGGDESICGDCPHRGNGDGTARSCYVTYHFGPNGIFKKFQRGGYTDSPVGFFKGLNLRLGSYGDPGAVPFEVWQNALEGTIGHTGYTHAWRKADPRLAGVCMASCDSESDRVEAMAKGYRTFRVRSASDSIMPGEFVCPASEEAGKRLTCENCKACAGTRMGKLPARSGGVVIIAHGNPVMKKNHAKRVSLTVGLAAV
jgi:hypothetical protein